MAGGMSGICVESRSFLFKDLFSKLGLASRDEVKEKPHRDQNFESFSIVMENTQAWEPDRP